MAHSAFMSSLIRLKFFLSTSEVYKPMFKAGYILIAAALIALSQVGPELIKIDHETYKLKFEVEYAIKQPVEGAECAKSGVNEPSCRLAQHQLNTLSVTLRMWSKFITTSGAVGTVLLIVGAFGWVLPLLTKRSHVEPGVHE